MGQSVSRMSHLIDDLMDLARARLGSGLGVHLVTISDLGSALQRAVEELAVAYPERQLHVDINIATPITGDKNRLQQLLSNLVANALTHGSSHRPVQVRAAILDEHLVIEVLNYGEPIAEKDLPQVLMPYWRPVTSSPGGGLGLGLYICSQIVKGHKGELSVTSSRESGTLFRVIIPI
jgi:signal transduction histidine kinase